MSQLISDKVTSEALASASSSTVQANKPQEDNVSISSQTNTKSSKQLSTGVNHLESLSKDMIQATGDYIKGEIENCVADYKLLEQMNKVVTDKYKNLTKYSSSIAGEMDKLNEAYATLLPLLSQIDDVEKCVGDLEVSANKLDAYSKRLEAKYKQFSEKHLNK